MKFTATWYVIYDVARRKGCSGYITHFVLLISLSKGNKGSRRREVKLKEREKVRSDGGRSKNTDKERERKRDLERYTGKVEKRGEEETGQRQKISLEKGKAMSIYR